MMKRLLFAAVLACLPVGAQAQYAQQLGSSSSIVSGATPCPNCATNGLLEATGNPLVVTSITPVASSVLVTNGASPAIPSWSTLLPAGLTYPTSTFTGVSTFANGAVATPSIVGAVDATTGIWFPAAGQIAISAGGVNKMNYNEMLANNWVFLASLNMNGNTITAGALVGSGLTATAAAPTVSASQIGYGGTVTANTNCGTLAGSAGCVVINVAGTAHYLPYY